MLTAPARQEDFDRLAERFVVSSGAAKVALHRLRKRYFEVLRQIVADTVDEATEGEVEQGELLAALTH